MSNLKSFWKNCPASCCRKWQISHFTFFSLSVFFLFFFKRKFRQENIFILFYFFKAFSVCFQPLSPPRTGCLLLYIHISVEKLETFISSFLVSPAPELPETQSTELKPSLFQQYLHYTGTQTRIKFRNNTNSGSFNIFFFKTGKILPVDLIPKTGKVLVRDRRSIFKLCLFQD